MPAECVIQIKRANGGRVPVHLSRSDRKSLVVSVHPDLRVEAIAPRDVGEDRIRGKLQKRLPWILKQRWFFESLPPHLNPRRYVAGETHYYLGRQYRLKVIKGDERGVKLKGRYLWAQSPNGKSPAEVRSLVEAWYQQRAKAYFERKTKALQDKLKHRRIPQPKVSVRRMKTRWGSCTRDGHILLNPDLVKVPSHCVEYVIIHELCHLVHPNHGAGFKRLLVNLLPDWEMRKQRLEQFRF